MRTTEIFINEFGRLRSGWRFAVFLFLFFLFSTIFGGALQIILARLSIDFENASFVSFIFQNFVLLTMALLVGFLCGKFFEDLPFRALGGWLTGGWFKDLSLGLLCGAVSILFAALIAFVFGGIKFQINDSSENFAILQTLGASLLVFTIGAAAEEAFFRGYLLQTFARAKLVWFGIILTSLFFAAVHTGNPSANYLSWLNTFLAGLWFGVAYWKTRNLWFPFGIHLTWNWLQGAVLGMNVSGIKEITTAPLFHSTTSVDLNWLTGGDYGIEGGFACTVALIFSTTLIWFAPFVKPTREMFSLSGQETQKPKIIS
jgi:membrane protease YdiL (CAAX protease family)